MTLEPARPLRSADATHQISLRSVLRLSARQLSLGALAVTGDPVAAWLRGSPGTDVYALYERLRAYGPVMRSRTGMYAVTSRALCDTILRGTQFGTRLPDGTAAGDDPLLTDPPDALRASFLEMDPPDHTRLRRIVAPAFRPVVVRGWQSRLDAILDDLIDRADSHARRTGALDLMTDIAAPFPITVISDILGVPDADTATFARIGTLVGQSLDGVRSVRHARELHHAGVELSDLFTRLLDERATTARDDVLSLIAAARTDGTASVSDAVATAGLLLIAGFETTVNLIGNGLAALHASPSTWRELVADPALAAAAVEETLRYDPPVQATARVAHTDIDLLGIPIRSADTVLLMLAAANRDPHRYAHPDRYDLHRTAEPDHLAFSSGIHYCLGAALARLEGQTAFRALAERWPHLRLLPGARRRSGSTIRGYRSLPAALR